MRIQTACLIAAINGKLTPNSYKLFAEWLGGYEYVVPDDRILNPDLIANLAENTATVAKTPTEFFSLWIAVDIIYHNASERTQDEILSWLWTLDSNNSPIHPQ